MSSTGLMKDFNPQRLKILLAIFFLALAIPTGGLVWQAYDQLKWEAFYQYRNMAEELTNRIDIALNSGINVAEARNFTDYAFLGVSGDPAANFLQRSPLSSYPVTQDLPGVIGYFQVGVQGEFSTPLLPEAGTAREAVGISEDEYLQRSQLAQEIQQVLAENQLIRSRTQVGLRQSPNITPEFSAATAEEESDYERPDTSSPRAHPPAGETATIAKSASPLAVRKTTVADSIGEFTDDLSADKDTPDRLATAPSQQLAAKNEGYSQQIFDQLNQPGGLLQSDIADDRIADPDGAIGESRVERQRSDTKRDVAKPGIDAAPGKKSEILERKELRPQALGNAVDLSPARSKRFEKSALPEVVLPHSAEETGGRAGLADLRINTFESEVDPFEFSLLDSGHMVLFRKVWRNGERLIQGLLIDQQHFLNVIIANAFRGTTLATMSTLSVAYQENVIATFAGRIDSGYPATAVELDGTLLYQSSLTAPMSGLQLAFSIDRLPPGPGARVLGWTTFVIAIVFLGGFFALYRTGLSQINLARQQQDFVAAVSHELKTPLTSIRMYGEMLREGWADEDKRQQYYGFIHDESERLTRLISNVLQLAKITRNEPQFDMQPRTVGELMSQIESKIVTQVENAGFELSFKRDPDTDQTQIAIDDDCFAQVIINLVDNAIKFSRHAATKRIEIQSTAARDGTVVFVVRDYGPGVPKDQMRKIFKLFYRPGSELTRETVGTGIGLAIVHQLTTAMNGTVDVINKDPGVEFRLSFPAD
ncbi:MAG: HAMP domain-containing histidine kinase [Gammaproteobacteria bacterium]|nr:HAMP domain-containing histidine kinase [Gammaproteobacteria bacterium]